MYYAAYPDGPSRLSWPGLIYVRVRPTWIRYSNYSVDPPEIVEFAPNIQLLTLLLSSPARPPTLIPSRLYRDQHDSAWRVSIRQKIESLCLTSIATPYTSREQRHTSIGRTALNNDGPQLDEELSRQQRNVYLVPESAQEPDLDALLNEFWEDIFTAELGSWSLAENDWPPSRTREMFNQWFDVELNASVYDLTPEEPLTQTQVDLEDLHAHRDDVRRADLTWNRAKGNWSGSNSRIEVGSRISGQGVAAAGQ